MRMYDVIEKKRDGNELSYQEIEFFIKGYCAGEIPDYQASALLMAIFLNGMGRRETADLTEIMANSGERIDLSHIKGIKVDKHSTGGVGDKTTLVAGPIVAACGISVAKMSGRGLGHTGGTIDKLESIPGMRTALGIDEFIGNVNSVGIAVAGQTGNLAPADKKLYALRDVTATINCIPLIASSIMSKKIASGADRILLDIKTGSGAFMHTLEGSIQLAEAMVGIGCKVGRKTSAIVTDMDVPLGNAIGNSLEVIEAIDTLKGKGPADLTRLSLEIAAAMLGMADVASAAECMGKAMEAVKSGKALNCFKQMISRQGGNAGIAEDYGLLPQASHIEQYRASQDGFITSIKTDGLGKASVVLGAGRETKESPIDYSAGIYLHAKTGDRVSKGDLLASLYSSNAGSFASASEMLNGCYCFSKTQKERRPLILAIVDGNGIKRIT